MKLSVLVVLGYVDQKNSAQYLGDEFDYAAPALGNPDVELVFIDRAWPDRWDLVKRACKLGLNQVRYIPPRPTDFQVRGLFCVGSAFNAGAVVSRGKLLMCIGDFLRLNTPVLEAVIKEYEETGRTLHPYVPHLVNIVSHEYEFSGHNPGVKVCTREQFAAINGYDEFFDGSWGNEDIEFQARLDALILDSGHPSRVRRFGVELIRTHHDNGDYPLPYDPPWTTPIVPPRWRSRCNDAYFQALASPRTMSGKLRPPEVFTPEMLEDLRAFKCGCSICTRGDKEEQLRSYLGTRNPDVGGLMNSVGARLGSVNGCINPWVEESVLLP